MYEFDLVPPPTRAKKLDEVVFFEWTVCPPISTEEDSQKKSENNFS
jgi:hypothetical protein